MTRAPMTLLIVALGLVVAGPAAAEGLTTTGGAGNTGVRAPERTGGVPAGTVAPGRDVDTRSSVGGVPGTMPGVNIGGTPTSGPPGTGGTAGGPALGNR